MIDNFFEFWIEQSLMSYAVGEPIYRVLTKPPTVLEHRTYAGHYHVVEYGLYEKTLKELEEIRQANFPESRWREKYYDKVEELVACEKKLDAIKELLKMATKAYDLLKESKDEEHYELCVHWEQEEKTNAENEHLRKALEDIVTRVRGNVGAVVVTTQTLRDIAKAALDKE